jgi:hypothetical protein
MRDHFVVSLYEVRAVSSPENQAQAKPLFSAPKPLIIRGLKPAN